MLKFLILAAVVFVVYRQVMKPRKLEMPTAPQEDGSDDDFVDYEEVIDD